MSSKHLWCSLKTLGWVDGKWWEPCGTLQQSKKWGEVKTECGILKICTWNYVMMVMDITFVIPFCLLTTLACLRLGEGIIFWGISICLKMLELLPPLRTPLEPHCRSWVNNNIRKLKPLGCPLTCMKTETAIHQCSLDKEAYDWVAVESCLGTDWETVKSLSVMLLN